MCSLDTSPPLFQKGAHMRTKYLPNLVKIICPHCRKLLTVRVISEDLDSPSSEVPTTKQFKPPSLSEVITFAKERRAPAGFSARDFIDFYESKGWKVGQHKMKNWKAACRRAFNWNWNRGKFEVKKWKKASESTQKKRSFNVGFQS